MSLLRCHIVLSFQLAFIQLESFFVPFRMAAFVDTRSPVLLPPLYVVPDPNIATCFIALWESGDPRMFVFLQCNRGLRLRAESMCHRLRTISYCISNHDRETNFAQLDVSKYILQIDPLFMRCQAVSGRYQYIT
jgi:hypothetical protein